MNLTDFHFIRPYWFFALLPAALFITLSVRNKLARGNWTEVCDDALLPFILQDNNKATKRPWSSFALSLATLLAIIALAGPTWERLPTPVFRNDAAVVIVLDLSRSMNASDIKPSRLGRARYKVADILQQRKDGLTALIVYAGDAFTVAPLTSDNATITNQLNALTTEIMPSQGSNTQAALQQAVELLQQAGQAQGSILLISDGINARLLDQSSEILGNYTLSVLGIGTAEGAPVHLANGGFLKDPQGNIVVPRLEVSKLTSLAHASGGIYHTISRDDRDIKAIIANIARATSNEAAKNTDHLAEQWAELGPWLLLLLLPLAALYFRKGLLVVPLLVLVNYPQDSYAFEWQDLWQTPDQQAQQAFNQQHYEQAAAQFQSPEWQAAAQYKAEKFAQTAETLQSLEQQTAESYYNQATALAKSGQLKPALDIYEKALALNPKHEDALYNKKIVEQALEKQDQNKQQQNSDNAKQSDNKQQKKDPKGQDQQQSDSSEQKQNDDQNSQSSDKSAKQQNTPSKEPSSDQMNHDQQEKNKEADKAQQQSEQQKQAEAEKHDKAQQAKSEQDKDTKKEVSQQQAEQDVSDEQKQAQAQWLKRIPDDPAGLLKRKFKYQYNQRNQGSQQDQDQSW